MVRLQDDFWPILSSRQFEGRIQPRRLRALLFPCVASQNAKQFIDPLVMLVQICVFASDHSLRQGAGVSSARHRDDAVRGPATKHGPIVAEDRVGLDMTRYRQLIDCE
jgi:hypothetical protein